MFIQAPKKQLYVMYTHAFSYFSSVAEKNYPWITELQSEGILKNPRTDYVIIKNVAYYPEKSFDESLYRRIYYKLPDDVNHRNKFYRIVRLIFASILNSNDFFSSLVLHKSRNFSKDVAILKEFFVRFAFQETNNTVKKMLINALDDLDAFFPNCDEDESVEEAPVTFGAKISNQVFISKYHDLKVKDSSVSQPLKPKDYEGAIFINPVEENVMSNVLPAYENQTVSNPTLIYGRPKEDWTENQLVSKIRELQKELNSYNDLATISKRFENKQNALKKDIATLVEILDSLE